MLGIGLLLVFVAVALLIFALSPVAREERPTLNLQDFGLEGQADLLPKREPEKKDAFFFLRQIALINRPLVSISLRQQLIRNLNIGQVNMTPEEFMLFKEISIVVLLLILPRLFGQEMIMFSVFMALGLGYIFPDFWLKGKIKKAKEELVRLLPDTVDLLGLCVNAGLDFMVALKWVVEKSAPSVIVNEMNNVLQEISVGKPRRDALRDLARKYDLPDLSTFSRTLIQADKMGTSVSDALNILSEDMRLARFRRGEAMALKAPIKLLAPLLLCIFPVVGILVGGPIFLDFMMNNPLKNMAGA